jgi:hypothetical protein
MVRDKLVELIGSTEYGNKSLIGHNFQKGFIEKIADHLIANGVTIQKWIPVTDRLPDKDGSYLILNKRKYIFDAEYESIYKSFGCWHEFVDGAGNEWIAYKEITHWMPLPEPPKGDWL